MPMQVFFKIVYFLGMVIQIIIRAPYAKMAQAGEKIEKREVRTEQVLLTLMTVVGLVIPLIYSVTPWLSFADYHLPA
jgi:hypothetical protein